MAESTNGVEKEVKAKNRLPKVSSIDGYMAKARKRATTKGMTFKGVNDDATVTLAVKSFPGFTQEDACVAAEGGATVQGKLTQKVNGKTVTFKETGKGDEGYEMAEDFFLIETNAE